MRRVFSQAHNRGGVNIRVITDAAGTLQWISSALKGGGHGVKAFDAHAILNRLQAENIIADKGYMGSCLRASIKATPGTRLAESEEEHNESVDQVRWPVERAIARIKTWAILDAA